MISSKPDFPSQPSPVSHDEPLTLTVHAMPVPGSDLQQATTASGRWKLIAVLLVCAAPVLASYFMYYVVRPEGRRNFGELIDPQKPLPGLKTLSLTGEQSQLTALKNQWLLISVAGATCDQACQQRLYLQRQLRESLGKEKDRLDRVWLIVDNAAVDEKLKPALAGSSVLRVQAGELANWLAPAPGQRLEDHLYVVDALGNWMMRFPANLDAASASKAKRDLDRLMRASSSWDKEGR
ncbi:MAG: putative rane protein [Polaromonas sp.]|nr:putative rane protein [Polaromonas sp.]